MIIGTFGLGFSMMMIAILLSFEENQRTASAAVALFLLGSSLPPFEDYFTDIKTVVYAYIRSYY